MAWGTYMLRSSFVSVFIRLRVMARAAHEPRLGLRRYLNVGTPHDRE
jgi:hypothetical protein